MRSTVSAAIAVGVIALATTVAPVTAQQPSTVHVPKSVLERYVGEWVYPNGNSVFVRVIGDTIFRETTGQRVRFVPISQTLFSIGPVFTAEFVIDKTGGITQILSGSGTEFRLTRKGSRPAVLPEPPAAVHVPTAVLERYVGTYEFIPGQMRRTDLRVVISLRGDTLIRNIGQEQILVPISETHFRVAGTSLMVEFVVDDAGVTQVLGSGAQQMIARLKPAR